MGGGEMTFQGKKRNIAEKYMYTLVILMYQKNKTFTRGTCALLTLSDFLSLSLYLSSSLSLSLSLSIYLSLYTYIYI